MAVPTIARARNIICSTLAALPLEQYSKLNGSHIATPAVINQPDPRVPGSAIYAWLAEDLSSFMVLVMDKFWSNTERQEESAHGLASLQIA
jgi:hypothetical protein